MKEEDVKVGSEYRVKPNPQLHVGDDRSPEQGLTASLVYRASTR